MEVKPHSRRDHDGYPARPQERRDAAARHRPHRALRRQRRPGRFFTHALGFREVAFAGLETGMRDRSTRVVEQGRIRFALTAPLHGGSEITRHVATTATVSRSWRCQRRGGLSRRGSPRRPRPARAPHGQRRARRGEDGDDRDLRRDGPHFVQRGGYEGAFLPGFESVEADREDEPFRRDRPRGRQRRARAHGGVGGLLRARLRLHRDDPLHRRGHLDRVLGTDVEGDGGRPRADQVPDQRAGRGPAQVADRGVPATAARASSTSPSTTDVVATVRTLRERGVRFLTTPGSYYEELPSGSARSTRTWPTCASSESSPTVTTRDTCCRSSPSRSWTVRPSSSR